MEIFRKIDVNQLVTESVMKEFQDGIKKQIVNISNKIKECDESWQAEIKRLELKGISDEELEKAKAEYRDERTNLFMERDKLLGGDLEVGKLELGKIMSIGAIDGPCEVKVGDKFVQNKGAKILIEDGIVTQIKEKE